MADRRPRLSADCRVERQYLDSSALLQSRLTDAAGTMVLKKALDIRTEAPRCCGRRFPRCRRPSRPAACSLLSSAAVVKRIVICGAADRGHLEGARRARRGGAASDALRQSRPATRVAFSLVCRSRHGALHERGARGVRTPYRGRPCGVFGCRRCGRTRGGAIAGSGYVVRDVTGAPCLCFLPGFNIVPG